VKTAPIRHGSFSIERSYRASPARTFAAWADPELKARWFSGPAGEWTQVRRDQDFRVGGSELVHGAFKDGRESIFAARYHAIEPDARLVYAYDMTVSSRHISVSLATVELSPTRDGGTRMIFNEQVAFLNDDYDLKSREDGTSGLLDSFARAVEDTSEIVSARLLDAPRARVFAAFSDARQLALWWGPTGFQNTISKFELRPGGAWRLVMHGPDGRAYHNASEFLEVVPEQKIVFQHLEPVHRFKMTMTFVELDARTLVIWRMQFESRDEAERVRAVVDQANEQNFDRLAAHLANAR
jgi:uncharacterized protein YndB with AHSA1/START domain